jgi:hypothetical protein
MNRQAGGIISRWQIKAHSLSRLTRSRSGSRRTRPNPSWWAAWRTRALRSLHVHPWRASVFDVCGGVRHHVLLFEGPTPDATPRRREPPLSVRGRHHHRRRASRGTSAARVLRRTCSPGVADPPRWSPRLLGGARGRRRATDLPGSNLRSASASIGPEGRPIRAQPPGDQQRAEQFDGVDERREGWLVVWKVRVEAGEHD